MDKKILTVLCLAVGFAALLLSLEQGAGAMLLAGTLSLIVIFSIRRSQTQEGDFLVQVFLTALLGRLVFGLLVHVFDLRSFFGGDALTYDFNGQQLANYWRSGNIGTDWQSQSALATSGSGWGMNYLTGAIYFIFGKNIYAAQSFCAVIGAATAPLTYVCSYKVFGNKRVGRTAAWLVAIFPAFIIWSGQLLKDGIIVFLLVVAMIIVLELQERLNYKSILILILAMGGIISLRFYIFYMIVLAVVGGFIIGQTTSPKSILQRMTVLVVLGLGLTYLGVIRNAGEEFNKYGSLERIQISRNDLAKSAESGFGSDLDVSTSEGAILALPIGFTYLMLAPFPWDMTSLRSGFTLPEMLVWWSLLPFLVAGIFYAVKNRLRKALPILIFTLMLTLAYSVFQGNVGTAYRQRTQIQVFLFMFIAVGWVMKKESNENKKYLRNRKIG